MHCRLLVCTITLWFWVRETSYVLSQDQSLIVDTSNVQTHSNVQTPYIAGMHNITLILSTWDFLLAYAQCLPVNLCLNWLHWLHITLVPCWALTLGDVLVPGDMSGLQLNLVPAENRACLGTHLKIQLLSNSVAWHTPTIFFSWVVITVNIKSALKR